MRTPWTVLVALFVLSCPARTSATEDPFAEYRLPEHRWSSGSANLSLYASQSGQFLQGAEEQRSSSGQERLDLVLQRGFDSDRRQFLWTLYTGTTGQLSHAKQDGGVAPPSWSESESRSQSHGEYATLSPAMRFYPAATSLGFGLSGVISGDWSRGWSRGDTRNGNTTPTGYETTRRTSNQSRANAYDVSMTARVGHGIVRDATVVEDVHVLEARLRAVGALQRPLSAATREKLAGLLVVSPRIAAPHERPSRYRWREIERLLVEDGALPPGGLGAYALQLAADPVAARMTRSRGHFLGAIAGFAHHNHIAWQATQTGFRDVRYSGPTTEQFSESGSRTASSSDGASAGLLFEWFRPVGWEWQLGLTSRCSAPARQGEHGLSTSTLVDVARHVADRWLVRGTVNHGREYVGPSRLHDTALVDNWIVQGRLTANYFVEDNVSAFVDLGEWQGRSRYGVVGYRRSSYFHNRSLSVGLTYRFLGRVSAPGLFETMTPM